MARRYRRRSPSDEINPVAIGILLLLGAGSLMRGLGDLPRPWQIAGAILAGSGAALCVWALAAWLRRQGLRRSDEVAGLFGPGQRGGAGLARGPRVGAGARR